MRTKLGFVLSPACNNQQGILKSFPKKFDETSWVVKRLFLVNVGYRRKYSLGGLNLTIYSYARYLIYLLIFRIPI